METAGHTELHPSQSAPSRRHYRIAMVAACPFPAGRGTPARIFHTADELARRGHVVDVVTYHLGEAERSAAFHIHRITNIESYQKVSPGPTLQKLLVVDALLASRTIGLLRRSHYDVIHAHHVEGLLAALPAHWLVKAPLIFDAHTLLETELPHYTKRLTKLLRWIGRTLDRWLPGQADRVIAVSDVIRQRMVEFGIRPDRVTVIPNGVEAPFFRATQPPPSDRNEHAPLIVFAGNLAPYQGLDLLLKAFLLCRQKFPDLRLRVVSDSPFDAYKALAVDLGVRDAVELVKSSLDDLPEQLAAADVVVNPRIDGAGVPQKLLNYMAVGCPIVSFAGSARHLVNESNALVVADGDLDAFANAILRLIDDRTLAARLGQEAQRFAYEELSWSRTADLIEEVYAQVVDRSRSS